MWQPKSEIEKQSVNWDVIVIKEIYFHIDLISVLIQKHWWGITILDIGIGHKDSCPLFHIQIHKRKIDVLQVLFITIKSQTFDEFCEKQAANHE